MNNTLFFKLAISTAFIAVPSVGCTQMGVSSASANVSADAQAKKALAWAQKSEKMLAKGQVDKALTYAEAAVEGELRNVEYRALLARIYMQQGRFVAAERTLMDVVELGQADPRTIVSLALAKTAQGKVESAISLVDAHRAILPASDYGLALALAGDNKRAVDVLVDAIRSNNATSRTRQNLALAYALDNRWREAQVMASQDMPQTVVDQRIVQWAQYARPGAYEVRVAGLLGVKAQADTGQPVRLALNAASTDVQMASVAAPEATSFAMAEPVGELAAIGAAPVDFGVGAEESVQVAVASAAPAFEAPLIKAPVGPSKAAEAAVKAPVKLALADTRPAATKSVAGTHLVQLGAYSSSANAKEAWGKLQSKYGVLQGFESASSSVTVNGKKLTRLAAMGFGNKASAVAACQAIKAKGGDCIVRSAGGETSAPVRMAQAKPRKAVKLAAR
ncbi:MAG: SPOR domain-containing protein [Sphingorhabdus sp.]